jgi:hypothetical protein
MTLYWIQYLKVQLAQGICMYLINDRADYEAVWITPLASLAKIGTPIFWLTILPPIPRQRAGEETELHDQNIGVAPNLWR